MAYGVILGQTPKQIENPTTIATNVSYNNSQTSSIITGNNIQEAIDELFTSVSNGKELVANAITDKGVATSATDTFATMANNINKLQVVSTGMFSFFSRKSYTSEELNSYSLFFSSVISTSDLIMLKDKAGFIQIINPFVGYDWGGAYPYILANDGSIYRKITYNSYNITTDSASVPLNIVFTSIKIGRLIEY